MVETTSTKIGDAKYTWAAKPGQVSHAIPVDRQNRTVCGLKVGQKWVKGSKRTAHIYLAKCDTCRRLAK